MKINTSAYKFPVSLRLGKESMAMVVLMAFTPFPAIVCGLFFVYEKNKVLGVIATGLLLPAFFWGVYVWFKSKRASMTIDHKGVSFSNATVFLCGEETKKYNADFSWSQIKCFGKGGGTSEEWANVLSVINIGGLEHVLAPVFAPAVAKAADKETSMWKLVIVLEDESWFYLKWDEFYNENDHVRLFESIEEEAIATLENRHADELGNKHNWKPTLTGEVVPHRAQTIRILGMVGFCVCIPFLSIPSSILAWRVGKADLEKMDDGLMDSSGREKTEGAMKWGIYACILHLIIVAIALIVNIFNLG